MKRKIFLSSIVLIPIFFGFIAYQLFYVVHEPFPKLAAGKYNGYFSGSLIGKAEGKIFFSVEVPEDSSILKLISYSLGWGTKSIDINNIAQEDPGASLIIAGPDNSVLKFGGKINSPDYISGKVVNVSTGQDANWALYLNPLKSELVEIAPEQRMLPDLKAEEYNMAMRVKAQKDNLEQMALEQSSLTKALLEGKTLQQKAENRFSEKQNKIEELKIKIAQVEKDLGEMQSALTVARSITQRGRFTTMARESLSREYTNIDSKLTGHSYDSDAALMSELARAKEALALQQKVLSQQDSNSIDSEGGPR